MTALLYGVDCSVPPDVLSTGAIFANGWRFVVGYLGGPRCHFSSNGVQLGQPGRLGWGRDAFVRVQQVGFLLAPPFYVGRTAPYDLPTAFTYAQGADDGNDLNELMGLSGFDENQPVTLDAEYGDFQGEPLEFYDYIAGLGQTVKQYNPNRKIVLYSDSYTLSFFGPDQGIDFKWGAAYARRPDRYNPIYHYPPQGMFDPTIPPPWSFWQFCNGAQFDVDSATTDGPWAVCTPP